MPRLDARHAREGRRDPSTADGVILLKVGVVVGLLLLVLQAHGAGWVARWLLGLALGALLVVGAVLVLAAIL
jgi:hypothetical protein